MSQSPQKEVTNSPVGLQLMFPPPPPTLRSMQHVELRDAAAVLAVNLPDHAIQHPGEEAIKTRLYCTHLQ